MTPQPKIDQAEISVACTIKAELGEGPVWDAARQVLWFVDIKQCRLFRLNPLSGHVDTWLAPAQIGWCLPRAEGGLLCGLQTGLHHFDWDTGLFSLLAEVEPDCPENRLNDATVDNLGRVWFGSMDDGESRPTGHFYRADAQGIARVISEIVITNGPAVSPCGTLLYHTDTLAGTISVSRIAGDDMLSDTRLFATIDPADGYPDGPVVDAEGCVWSAVWGGWCAHRYSPAGERLQTVRFPAANITKLAFGGPDRTTVYATSARKGLDAAALAAQPLAGDVFVFKSRVPGQPVTPVGTVAPRRA